MIAALAARPTLVLHSSSHPPLLLHCSPLPRRLSSSSWLASAAEASARLGFSCRSCSSGAACWSRCGISGMGEVWVAVPPHQRLHEAFLHRDPNGHHPPLCSHCHSFCAPRRAHARRVGGVRLGISVAGIRATRRCGNQRGHPRGAHPRCSRRNSRPAPGCTSCREISNTRVNNNREGVSDWGIVCRDRLTLRHLSSLARSERNISRDASARRFERVGMRGETYADLSGH